MSPRSSRRRVCIGVSTVIAAIVVGWGAATLAAAAVPSAQVTIINPQAQNQPFYSGGSTTQFGMSLPDTQGGLQGQSSAAFCANYSQSNPQELDSYLVPEGTDPSTLTFSGAGPSNGKGLFEATDSYYGFKPTNSTTGQLPALPSDFEWEPSVTGSSLTVPQLTGGPNAGVWDAGLACVDEQGADQGDVTTLWNFQVTFAASSSDPNGFTWSVPVPPPPTTTTTTTAPASVGSGSTSGGSGSGSGASSSSGASSTSQSPTTTVPAESEPSGAFDDGDLGASGGTSSVSQSTTPTRAASGTAADGTGSSGPGSNAPVKDPGVLRDALTAAGFSSARGIALDLLGVGLLLLVIGLVRRRKSEGAEEGAS